MPDLKSMPIDAHTQVVGVLGYPVRHSLSPTMHNAAFEALGLNWVYLAFEVPPERLAEAIAGMRALGIRGLNLTIPHKEAACSLVDRLTAQAEAIGAVNTLFWDGDTLVGDNTDSEGFLRSLLEAGVEPKGQRVLVLGAGGSARAVVYALRQRGASVWLANRNLQRAEQLAQRYDAEGVLSLDAAALAPQLTRFDGVVNCTPLGMHPNEETMPPLPVANLPAHAWVCDLVYRPLETRLLREAHAHGLKTVSGLGMLLWQGALAFERWTGTSAPVAVMARALRESLA